MLDSTRCCRRLLFQAFYKVLVASTESLELFSRNAVVFIGKPTYSEKVSQFKCASQLFAQTSVIYCIQPQKRNKLCLVVRMPYFASVCLSNLQALDLLHQFNLSQFV